MTIDHRAGRNGRIFWPCLVVGWVLMAYGARGLLQHADDTAPLEWSIWFVAAAIVHDFVLAPIVFAIGVGLQRVVPSRVRPIIQGALVVTGLVVLTSVLFAGRLGGNRGNPSALPNDYPIGLVITVSLVWGITALPLVRAWRRRRHA